MNLEDDKNSSRLIPPKLSNDIAKIRTFNYPFMYHLKHRYPKNTLSDTCPLCSLNQKESLHHILTQCPIYSHLQDHFQTKYLHSTSHLISNSQLIESDFNNINIFTINAFLQLRWKRLQPLLDTIKADCKSSIANSHSGFLPESDRTASWGNNKFPSA